ncbi:MAG: 5-formyltetrahydrofolate cyclo-ligase [Parcubacteria bacterium C7867-004]|nr:MAG: 5-formyltetrahydrofolate cyclo-ligase [Parcubacteria bacterium C7867-004]
MTAIEPETLEALLASYDACIAYAPITGEPEWKTAPLPEHLRASAQKLPVAGIVDPYAIADSLSGAYSGKRVVLLIPGTAFDTQGTRHGRGGGWYDRFLSKVPSDWLRIGVTRARNFSADALLRQPHDEPVDLVIIEHERGIWNAYDTRPRVKPDATSA